MTQTLLTIGSLFGGLGLFLLAMKMITDGLKFAAGKALHNMLGRWTHTPARGIGAGIMVTSLVQSSSAVTVATIGFVNAGLLSLYQSLGVVYGANIGTTITGWLVAVVGFDIKLELFALPMIGLGMALRLSGPGQRRGALGEALAGFGLFFIGIDVLKDAFEVAAASMQVPTAGDDDLSGILILVGTGFLMTMLTQSSSAAIAIILTAASGGVLSLSGAAAMVIGANVGTTSTAALTVIGATPNAKRVAAAHIFFNLVTALVALLLLPVLFWIIRETSRILGLAEIPALTLAMFHTVFNILGVMLLWPLTGRLAAFLEQRLRTAEEIEGRPKHLDKTTIETPALALTALVMELGRIGDITRRMGLAVLSAELAPDKRIKHDRLAVDNLTRAVSEFITRLGRVTLSQEVAERLPKVLRAAQYFSTAAELVSSIHRAQMTLTPLADRELAEKLSAFKSDAVTLLQSLNPQAAEFSVDTCETQLQVLQSNYQTIKADLLLAGARLRIGIQDMNELLEQLSRVRRMLEQQVKGTRYRVTLGQDSSTLSLTETNADAVTEAGDD